MLRILRPLVTPFSPEKLDCKSNDEGFSVIELLIVASIISVVTGFALMQITRARLHLVRENAVRLFVSCLSNIQYDSRAVLEALETAGQPELGVVESKSDDTCKAAGAILIAPATTLNGAVSVCATNRLPSDTLVGQLNLRANY